MTPDTPTPTTLSQVIAQTYNDGFNDGRRERWFFFVCGAIGGLLALPVAIAIEALL